MKVPSLSIFTLRSRLHEGMSMEAEIFVTEIGYTPWLRLGRMRELEG